MKKKKNSAMKKLIPATSMLLVSATMLTASTYAWFTMSREVEVTGIKMTASVPEDLQISPGWTTSAESNNGDPDFAVNGDRSFLTSFVSGTSNHHQGTSANTPSDTDTQMWSNLLQIDHYYTLGRIIPASSNNGQNIFFTPDATNAGKDVLYDANFYAATDGQNESGTYMTALHAKNNATDPWNPSGATGGYQRAASWNDTKDDGYYVDIPVWLRSSSSTDINLKVKAQTNYNTTAKTSGAEIELYKAVRVAVFPEGGCTTSGTGIIDVKDASGAVTRYGGRSVVDYYNRGGIPSGAVSSAGSVGGSYDSRNSGTAPDWGSKYSATTPYNNTSVVTVPAVSGTSSNYGTAVKVWIRVWLEGEDPQCWNQNAGQDFTIDLAFEKMM